MIQPERVKPLNDRRITKGRYVLYWMQASQRTEYNHALEYAIGQANETGLPLVVFFGITDDFPEANERHYYFILEGLREVKSSLEKRGIKFVLRHASPERGVLDLSKNASLVVVDRGYLRIQRAWRDHAARHIACPFIQVESDVVVPVEFASQKEEYSAATFRPKIKGKLKDFLIPLRKTHLKIPSSDMDLPSFAIDDLEVAVSRLRIDREVARTPHFQGGVGEAKKRLRHFVARKLDHYAQLRNDPTLDYVSQMSPYLHFGQISPLYVALQILKTKSPGVEAYLEELLVRRELSVNFLFYNSRYDAFDGLPLWAQKTLEAHKTDRREYVYSAVELEGANTHDPYWNAAQKEMVITGKMHGYMRMYWSKKILEWSRTPREAFHIALTLNNKYELDGRDPNGFAGVAWCFGKHDRPWGERPIFGNVRYMNDRGLQRKFDIDRYVRRVEKMLVEV